MPRLFDALRRRAEQSDWLPGISGASMATWTRFCDRTTRWQTEGVEEIAATLATGPVIVVLWHEMIMMGPAHWRADWGPLVTLHDTSPAGRTGAAGSARLGSRPFVVSPKRSNMGLTRDMLGLVRGGASLAVTGDGPRGPRRVLKDPPLDWARAAGVPVFAYGWAQAGQRRADSWDRMILARPFARGAHVFQRWETEIPRRLDDTTREMLRADLAARLTATAERAETLVTQAPRG
jgi:lysophospholipid acyltransferase (LPLAT)-like uncharacterized protein